MDGIVYGAVSAIGFATVENVSYVSTGGAGLGLLRAFTAVPMHAFMGAISGYFVGRQILNHRILRKDPTNPVDDSWFPAFCGIGAAMLLHGFYDFPVLAATIGKAAKAAPGTMMTIGQLARFTTFALLIAWRVTTALVRRTEAAQEARLTRSEHLADEVRQLRRERLGGWVEIGFGGLLAAASGAAMLGILVAAFKGPGPSPGPATNPVAILVVCLFLTIPGIAGTFVMKHGIERQNQARRRIANPAGPPGRTIGPLFVLTDDRPTGSTTAALGGVFGGLVVFFVGVSLVSTASIERQPHFVLFGGAWSSSGSRFALWGP